MKWFSVWVFQWVRHRNAFKLSQWEVRAVPLLMWCECEETRCQPSKQVWAMLKKKKKKMLKMEDYNRDLIAVQALLLSRAVHCVFSSVEMTHLISFFFLGGGGFDRRSDGGDPPGAWKERRADQLAGLVILHSKLCGDLSNAIFFFFFLLSCCQTQPTKTQCRAQVGSKRTLVRQRQRSKSNPTQSIKTRSP